MAGNEWSEEELKPFAGTRKGNRSHCEGNQHDKKKRHQHLAGLLDATADACDHHGHGQRREDAMEDNRGERGADEGSKDSCDRFGVHAGEGAASRLDDVGDAPARNN